MNLVSREELQAFVHELLYTLAPATSGATVLALSGDLGAGKTTFTQALARELGIRETVTSPTFVIEKRYPLTGMRSRGFMMLIHIDAYRLEGGSDLEKLGFTETLADQGNLIVIEWPEKVTDILPKDYTSLTFEIFNEDTRILTISRDAIPVNIDIDIHP